MVELRPGVLLIATPKLVDPNFTRTVVLLCSSDDVGAMGVVLNRPIGEIEVDMHLPDWLEALSEPHVMFRGGPVEPTAAIGIGHEGSDGPPESWTAIDHGLGIVDLGSGPESARPLGALRIFLGYAGWTAGQLRDEIEEGAWFVVPADPADAFDSEPETLWRRVLQRQPGDLAMFAYFPTDLRAN